MITAYKDSLLFKKQVNCSFKSNLKDGGLRTTSRRFQEVSVLEALDPELQGVFPGLVLLPVHHRRHRLRVLHDHRHLAVPLSQHAPVVDVGRTCSDTEEQDESDQFVPADGAAAPDLVQNIRYSASVVHRVGTRLFQIKSMKVYDSCKYVYSYVTV